MQNTSYRRNVVRLAGCAALLFVFALGGCAVEDSCAEDENCESQRSPVSDPDRGLCARSCERVFDFCGNAINDPSGLTNHPRECFALCKEDALTEHQQLCMALAPCAEMNSCLDA